MTSNHIFTNSTTSTIKSIDVSDTKNLSVSDTSFSSMGRIITVNQLLYACPSLPSVYNAPIAQIDVTDPTNLTFVQYIYCNYLSYVSEYDDTLPGYPVYYDKWVLITGYVFKDPQVIPDPGNDHYVVLWAIDVTDPANPSVTSYEIESRNDETLSPWVTYSCILGDILIVAIDGYSRFIKRFDLTNLPTSISLQDTYSGGAFQDVSYIAGNASNFYIPDAGYGAVHSFSYSGGSLSHLDTLELSIG